MEHRTWREFRFDKGAFAEVPVQTLDADISFQHERYAKGSQFKAIEGFNHGFVCFLPGTRRPDGTEPSRRVWKF